jgi:hypothetical protein
MRPLVLITEDIALARAFLAALFLAPVVYRQAKVKRGKVQPLKDVPIGICVMVGAELLFNSSARDSLATLEWMPRGMTPVFIACEAEARKLEASDIAPYLDLVELRRAA